ncbi:Hypothetical predicted protein [Octopus vulgaris]|uniref:Sortilin N-terminal domain-containing protein n=1 Tax=Octopus vulgaris TaxID=6645 RepID=A0AA36BEA1_OCTVU|nr:Hypothetical predicted protein [Octopus vulgaris]
MHILAYSLESKREGQSLLTSYVNLPDWNHNEAIVHWSGNKSNVIFVLTRDHDPSGQVVESSLWQSKDYGGTFKRINFTENALIYYYFTSNVNHNKLIFTDVKNKQIFLTYNEAEHMIRVSIDFTPNRIVLHPTMEDWVLGYDLKAGKQFPSSMVFEDITSIRFKAVIFVMHDIQQIH